MENVTIFIATLSQFALAKKHNWEM